MHGSLLLVRPAERRDLHEINEIYNRYVAETHYTFDVEPMTMEWRHEWFSHYAGSGRCRALVAETVGNVIGYATSSPLRPKPAYQTSIEVSVYVRAGAAGQGIGSHLYADLFAALQGEDVHRAYAGIALPNPASVALHERFAFKQVALFTEQGRKFGRYWDVAWFEKPLNAG